MLRSAFVFVAFVLSVGSLSACGSADDSADQARPVTCERYCATVVTNCTGDNSEYEGQADCESVCADWEQGDPAATSGDSISCRYTYAQQADEDDVCIDAGPDSALCI